ncbi:hypothetical protein HK097_011114 [Rhizophlyctis rosea]|uniref:Uncharacterized protein n=1 Tax=Rhizophlyctis rosea TaxID=64517 RepID=A0AAD5SJV6_9FUNG|nr:hypothetical protein HK097_011114 [Rhizophlyctis rosea]
MAQTPQVSINIGSPQVTPGKRRSSVRAAADIVVGGANMAVGASGWSLSMLGNLPGKTADVALHTKQTARNLVAGANDLAKSTGLVMDEWCAPMPEEDEFAPVVVSSASATQLSGQFNTLYQAIQQLGQELGRRIGRLESNVGLAYEMSMRVRLAEAAQSVFDLKPVAGAGHLLLSGRTYHYAACKDNFQQLFDILEDKYRPNWQQDGIPELVNPDQLEINLLVFAFNNSNRGVDMIIESPTDGKPSKARTGKSPNIILVGEVTMSKLQGDVLKKKLLQLERIILLLGIRYNIEPWSVRAFLHSMQPPPEESPDAYRTTILGDMQTNGTFTNSFSILASMAKAGHFVFLV